jgi:flagellin-like protein
MKFEKQTTDSGISPVVGVILMVAITVVLSAIIATFVLDLGGSVGQNPSAGVTFDEQADGSSGTDTDTSDRAVVVNLVSLENADHVDVLRNDGSNAGELSSVGSSLTVDSSDGTNGLTAGDEITVTATFDGKTTVTQSYTVQG